MELNLKSPKSNCFELFDEAHNEPSHHNHKINDFINTTIKKNNSSLPEDYNFCFTNLSINGDTIISTSEAEILSLRRGALKNKPTSNQFRENIKTGIKYFDEIFNSELIQLNTISHNELEYSLNDFSINFPNFYVRENSLLFTTNKKLTSGFLGNYRLPFKVSKLKKNRLYFFNFELGLIEIEKIPRFYDITNFRYNNKTLYTISLDGDLNIYPMGEGKKSTGYHDIWEYFRSNSQYHTLDLEINKQQETLEISTNIGLLLRLDLNTLKLIDTITTPEIWSQRIVNLNEVIYALNCNFKTFYIRDRAQDQNQFKLVFLDYKNYIFTLPNSPYYMCSKDASKMLHYVTPSLKVIGFEQLDPVYNRPDIVLDSIGKYFGGADQELVANYRQSWEKRIDRLGLDKEKLGKGEIAVPNAEIVGADAIAFENKVGNLNIRVSANDPKYPLRRFNVFVNEVPLYGSAGISIAHLKKQAWDTTVSVLLSVGENKIQVSVMNELGLENFKYPTYVNYTPENNVVAKTHYIGIGVNEFKEKGHTLKYCVNDVRDLAKAFATQNKNIDTLLFTNQQVTKENILALKEYLNKTGVNDKVIISCSSHGLLDDSLNFYLAMHDVDFNNPKARGLKYEALESLLDGIPARQKLLLLDACNSGENDKTEILKQELQQKEKNMDSSQVLAARGVIIKLEEENKSNFKKMNELFVNVLNNTGSVIISAAGGQESALEAIEVDGETIKNGAFTYSILECLKQNEGKELKVNTLKQYAEKRVEEITNGKQKPTSRQETMEVDWGVR